MPGAKDEPDRPEPKRRASRPRRRGEPKRESVRKPDRETDHEGERSDEQWDDPAEHVEIERRRFAGGERFAGGLAPTPELYALAREQWHRMPGVVIRSSMDPVVGDQPSGDAQLPGQARPDENGSDQ
jgi:hypothetical protein